MIKRVLVIACLIVGLTLVFSPAAAASGSLTTTYTFSDIGATTIFEVITTKPLVIDRFDTNLFNSTSSSCVVRVYYRAGSYVGFETTPAAWTLLGEVTVTSSGSSTAINIGGLTIPAGQVYSIYIGAFTGTCYLLSTLWNTGVYSNADLQILKGGASATPFGTAYGNFLFNGTIYYSDPPVAAPVTPPAPITQAVPGPDMVSIPEGSVVGSFMTNTPLYYAPDPIAATYPPMWMDAGQTLWVVGVNEAHTFYKVLFVGKYYWVPVETMGPNYDTVWGGSPLPTTVVQ